MGTVQVVVMASPVCVTQQTVKLLRFNFNFRRLYYVRTLYIYNPIPHEDFKGLYLGSIPQQLGCACIRLSETPRQLLRSHD